MSGSGITWAICKSAPRSRHMTTPAPHHCFLQAGCPSCRPTNSVKALKAQTNPEREIIYMNGHSCMLDFLLRWFFTFIRFTVCYHVVHLLVLHCSCLVISASCATVSLLAMVRFHHCFSVFIVQHPAGYLSSTQLFHHHCPVH